MSTPASDRGRSNRQRGYRAELDLLNRHIRPLWPHADHITGAGRGDYTGIGDICLEATIDRWAKMGESSDAETSKIAQAKRDARTLGLDDRWAVAKRGESVHGWEWFWLADFDRTATDYVRLQQLERCAAQYERAWGHRLESGAFVKDAERYGQLEQANAAANDEWQRGYDTAYEDAYKQALRVLREVSPAAREEAAG